MKNDTEPKLRTGFTTGACATGAAAAATGRLLNGDWNETVQIQLPKGQDVAFEISHQSGGDGWAEAGIIKDAGDDPDVTHGCLVKVRVEAGGEGITFMAGQGVGTVTMAGLPIRVGQAAINPVPRQMITAAITAIAKARGVPANFIVTVSIPNGDELAEKTWNPRLGIKGGLSILGTTGIVRPYSCASWIASIHRGIDVARADGLTHVCGATGNMSEKAAQAALGLPDHAMLDMGDFAGGMLKYLARNPVEHVTIAGGFGKLTKLAQGAVDLHSKRSQVDFEVLGDWAGEIGQDGPRVRKANTAMEVLEFCGPSIANLVADRAAARAKDLLKGTEKQLDVLIVSRSGEIVGHSDDAKVSDR